MKPPMTLPKLANWVAVAKLVGDRPDKRWGRACLTTRRWDGDSTATWFGAHDAKERIEIVRAALLKADPWAPLLRVSIPKGPASTEVRWIDMPTVLDAARLYLLHDELNQHAEKVLTKVAVGYRRGVRTDQTVRNAHATMKRLPYAMVIDIERFFDTLPWRVIDKVIDELPAHERVRALLKNLVRVTVIERRSRRVVDRETGIPQGLSISPVLANLALGEFDRHVAHAASGAGGVVRRFCDDVLVLGPTESSLMHIRNIITDRLRAFGLKPKADTGIVVDTRVKPISWLGISFSPDGLDVPARTIDRKRAELQAELDRGLIGPEGVEDSLSGLHQYYQRILSSERSLGVIRSLREGLSFPDHQENRKEGISHLKSLIDDRPRGHMASWDSSGGQPDGSDDLIPPRTSIGVQDVRSP